MSDNLTILVADDEPDILDVMAKKIGQEGFSIIKAQDGLKAWEEIQENNPDIILLDINMPGLNGFEVLQKVRANPNKEKWQPVIMVSARRELDDIKQGYELEADHYITKPCQISDILKAIRLMVNLIPQRKPKSELD